MVNTPGAIEAAVMVEPAAAVSPGLSGRLATCEGMMTKHRTHISGQHGKTLDQLVNESQDGSFKGARARLVRLRVEQNTDSNDATTRVSPCADDAPGGQALPKKESPDHVESFIGTTETKRLYADFYAISQSRSASPSRPLSTAQGASEFDSRMKKLNSKCKSPKIESPSASHIQEGNAGQQGPTASYPHRPESPSRIPMSPRSKKRQASRSTTAGAGNARMRPRPSRPVSEYFGGEERHDYGMSSVEDVIEHGEDFVTSQDLQRRYADAEAKLGPRPGGPEKSPAAGEGPEPHFQRNSVLDKPATHAAEQLLEELPAPEPGPEPFMSLQSSHHQYSSPSAAAARSMGREAPTGSGHVDPEFQARAKQAEDRLGPRPGRR